MIKFLRFFLPLCIFLPAGFSQAAACAHVESTGYSPQHKLPFQTDYATDKPGKDHQSILTSMLPEPENGKVLNCAADEEEGENEMLPFRKFQVLTNGFSTAFNVQISGYFIQPVKKCWSLSRHFSYYPFHRNLYLILEVFRI
jgi:hypothetical protein